jgi:hypothetical protein
MAAPLDAPGAAAVELHKIAPKRRDGRFALDRLGMD